jgi:hypothetical protein
VPCSGAGGVPTTNVVVKSADEVLGLAVLRRGVGTRKPEADTMSGEMVAQAKIVELFAIVSLKSEKGKLELCSNISMKMKQTLQNFRFRM